ncbi:MAG: hypothetical protein OSA81_04975 [Longimicrobiales bacterium]|nr:hypothetical protein [Longimicrobiales bacterium]
MTRHRSQISRGVESGWVRAHPGWGGLALAVVLVVSAALSVSPLQDAVTGSAVSFAHQTRPIAYLLGAPLFGAWDTLSLLTLTQHYAVLLTLVLLYVSLRWRVLSRARIQPLSRPPALPIRIGKEVTRAGIALVLLFGFYLAAMVLPRPMTGMRLADADLLSIDFHSHTLHSHDGWSLFAADGNRGWHEAGGFDAAYVTDHYTWKGFDESAANNPATAGERTVILEGAEIRIHLRPTNALGARDRYLFALDADSVYMEADSLEVAHARGERPPTLFYTMPGPLKYLIPLTEETPSGMIGIEINDGSPRGLEQVRAERAEIIAAADSFDLALIGGANLHGWGRTVASWSVMSIPGWPDMAPVELGEVIDEVLHANRRSAVLVVERRMPYHNGSPIRMVATLPWLTWEYFRMLSWGERLSWLLWLVAVPAAIGFLKRRRQRG